MVKINYVSSSFKLNSNLQGKVKPISKISKTKDKPKDENNNYLYAFMKELEKKGNILIKEFDSDK